MNTDGLMRFVGNPAAYALQQEDGSYKPVRKAVTGSLLKQHLTGEITVGTYVNVGDMARWVCFDVDTGDDAADQATAVVTEVINMGVPEWAVGVEFSGRKGFHVWVLIQDFREAFELRRFGRAVLALAKVECEVFPKQDVARDLGNLVKLPGGKHRVSGMASEWLTDEPKPCPLVRWTETVVPLLPKELAGRRFTGNVTERFPCMEAIQNEGVSEGGRNNQLTHLAAMLRRAGVNAEYVAAIITAVNEKGDPVDPYELASIIASGNRTGPLCDQLPKDRQCGELCLRARTQGLYTRPKSLANAAPGENIVVTLASHEEKVVTLEHPDAQTIKGALI